MGALERTHPAKTDNVVQWLLDGDPSVRWQVLRDLTGAPERAVERERRKIARRALLAQVDFDHLHHAAAPRFRPAAHQPASAQGLHAPARWRPPAGWRNQLWMARPQRDLHHGNDRLHPLVLSL